MTAIPVPAANPRRARSRWLPAIAVAATLVAATGVAQAGDVRWRIGIDLPLPPLPPLPGVVVRSAPVYAPPPVVYAPSRPYADVYGPSYRPSYDDGYGYGPEVVTYESYPRPPRYGYRYVEPAPVYVQPRVYVRPVPVHRHWDRYDRRDDRRHDRHDRRDDRRDDRGWDRGRN